MSVGVRDFTNKMTVTELLAPIVVTATQTSAAIDTSLYRRLAFLISAGVATDGTYTPKIQTSATSGGSYADDVANVDAFTVINTTDDDQLFVVEVDPALLDERYMKLVVTAAATTTGTLLGITLLGELKRV